MTTKGEVEFFLREMREKIKIFNIAFRPRDKNLEAIAELDILALERIAYLNRLTSENYYRGPTEDTFNPSKPNYYEFGIIINGIEVYIKISLGLENKRVDCMSFHKAEKTITYPLKLEKL